MEYGDWKRIIYPSLTAAQRSAWHAAVKALRSEGWSLYEACVQAACTFEVTA